MIEEKQYDIVSGKVFVFGSNRAGIHGAGAALYARKYLGALQRIGEGPLPDSVRPSCYALPTKDERLVTLPIDEIRRHVATFLIYAKYHVELRFFITRLGCGLAGYTDYEIAPLFIDAPPNCELPNGWEKDGFCHDVQS